MLARLRFENRFARGGFTLTELFVAIFFVAILVALLLQGLSGQRIRGPSRRAVCQNNLRQLALASLNHESARQKLPPGVVDDDGDLTDAMHTGFVSILPFIELNAIYDKLDRTESWKSENNMLYAIAPLPAFVCSSNPDGRVAQTDDGGFAGAVSDYAFCKGAEGYLGLDKQFQNGAFDVNSEVKISQFTDGTSNTILLGEAASNPVIRTGVGGEFGLGQLWVKADFDGDHGFGNEGGRGSCLAVTGQHPGPDNEWGTDDDLLTPIGQNPSELSVDNGGGGVFEHATDRVRGFFGFHDKVIHFAYADGSTHSIPTSVDPKIMILLSVRNDGKKIETQDF